MSFRRALLSFAFGLGLPLHGQAQTVTGLVVDASSNPVYGVVVLLMDSASRVSARSLSTERGEFRLAASGAGVYRIRTLRIGFKPVVSAPFRLAVGEHATERLVVTNVALGLDTIRVAGQNVCRAFTDSGAATFAVWDQIRTALTAAELTAATRTIAATTVKYDRAFDARDGHNRLLSQKAHVSTDYVTTAWRALPPDSLRRVGYIVTEPDNTVVYYAPGLDMLLSPIFVEDHCFRLVTDKKRVAQLGIAFEPTPERKHGKPEIRGTVWVDRASSELRDLEFRFVNALPDQEDQARGELSFVRMRDGTWAISRWDIRMPLLEQVIRPGHGAETEVSQIIVSGGTLAVARQSDDTLWRGPDLVIHGLLRDSASGSPVRRARVVVAGAGRAGSTDDNGRFAIGGLQPGQYTIEIHTPSLDSMRATHRTAVTLIDSTALELRVPSGGQLAAGLCPGLTANGGIVLGSLRLRGQTTVGGGAFSAMKGARVVAEWRPDSADRNNLRRLQSTATSDAQFKLCGVPENVALSLTVKTDSAETAEPNVVRIPPASRLGRVDVTLDRESDLSLKGATFTGVVVADSTELPIPAAEIAFPELGKSTLADSHGAFRIFGIPQGDHRLIVRRLGFGAAETRVTFTGHETVERRVVLGKAVVLDAVRISAQAIDRTMPGLQENMRLGLGHFATRDELEKYTGMAIRTVLQQLPGMAFAGERGHAFPATTRQPAVMCPPVLASECFRSHGYYVPENFEANQGIGTACYALVYLDGVLMNGSKEPTEPFDLNTIAPENVEAVEWYSGPSQTPMKYARMGSACGVLVIWTRR